MYTAALNDWIGYLFNLERLSNSQVASLGKKLTGEYRVKGENFVGWQKLLAKARSSFLYNLVRSNSLTTGVEIPQILEIDDGKSLLSRVSKRYDLDTITYHPSSLRDVIGNFTVGVTHTLLEHYGSLEEVDELLTGMSKHATSMVHQVHESDTPTFNWDETHRIDMTRNEWSQFFSRWADEHKKEGWAYLGNHQGMNGRPANYVLERNGCLPFYKYYDKSFTRRLVKEITAANVVSISRIPLLLTSFAVARDNPWLLSSLLATIFALDAADGSLARKGFGNSPAGPHIDILSDHVVEFITIFEFAYNLNSVPHEVPWILAARNAATDFMRLYNAVFLTGENNNDSHPHVSFGTFDNAGRALSAGVKTVEAVTVPIIQSLGIYLSTAHVLTSLYRGLPVIKSDRSKQIYRDIFKRLKNRLGQ